MSVGWVLLFDASCPLSSSDRRWWVPPSSWASRFVCVPVDTIFFQLLRALPSLLLRSLFECSKWFGCGCGNVCHICFGDFANKSPSSNVCMSSSFLWFVWFLCVSHNKSHLLHSFQHDNIEDLVSLLSAPRDQHHHGVLEILSLVYKHLQLSWVYNLDSCARRCQLRFFDHTPSLFGVCLPVPVLWDQGFPLGPLFHFRFCPRFHCSRACSWRFLARSLTSCLGGFSTRSWFPCMLELFLEFLRVFHIHLCLFQSLLHSPPLRLTLFFYLGLLQLLCGCGSHHSSNTHNQLTRDHSRLRRPRSRPNANKLRGGKTPDLILALSLSLSSPSALCSFRVLCFFCLSLAISFEMFFAYRTPLSFYFYPWYFRPALSPRSSVPHYPNVTH